MRAELWGVGEGEICKCHPAGFGDGGRLYKLEKPRTQVPLWSPQKDLGPAPHLNIRNSDPQNCKTINLGEVLITEL